jgi:hypothetical protein
MSRGRHRRPFSVLAFALLALVAELIGRDLTSRIDVGRHVRSPANASADYYPVLLVGVKLGIGLLLARLAWRLVRARATAVAAHRVLGSSVSPRAPRLTLRLAPRLWLAFFVVTALIYLVQTDAEHAAAGRWPVLGPWLHSSALPVFAVLSVVLALIWSAVQTWLADYESYAAATAERAMDVVVPKAMYPTRPSRTAFSPRRLFGLAFEIRPPPAPA